MSVTLRNTTKSDLGIGLGIVVPALGEVVCSIDDWKQAMNSGAVQGWLNAGKIIPVMDAPRREMREFRDPAPEDAAPEPVSAPHTADSLSGPDTTAKAAKPVTRKRGRPRKAKT